MSLPERKDIISIKNGLQFQNFQFLTNFVEIWKFSTTKSKNKDNITKVVHTPKPKPNIVLNVTPWNHFHSKIGQHKLEFGNSDNKIIHKN